ncbi:hypothetical protein E1B28_012278 [Marasmius oreades]|uniref:Uncharacterized protein n=1 Tax=Marasmius oreades TaxID=181124 RepID=A0A9P7UQL6_9AGAR|nr:uncharacterized protein E1B28_012278 [Marasmius oreades]KAG7088264.1 hypothetical protein E1B28_012278 [Marasmius oreades]
MHRRFRRASLFRATWMPLHYQPQQGDTLARTLQLREGQFVTLSGSDPNRVHLHSLPTHSLPSDPATTSRALSIVDKAQCLIVVGLKKIQDKTYDDNVKKVAELLERARSTKMTLGPADTNHLRGEGFPAAACGWSMGQGQKQPMHTGGKYAGVIQELIAEPCIQRVASVQDAGFACWSFKNYKYYLDAMKKLGASVERFELNFE